MGLRIFGDMDSFFVLLVGERRSGVFTDNRRYVLRGLAISALGILIGILPYINFKIVERSQFYAEPSQAIFLAFLIMFAAGFVPVAMRYACIVALTLVIVFL